MTLRQTLDSIVFFSGYYTSPASTPCWEWLSEKFKETVARYAPSLFSSVTITMGDKWFSIEIDEEDKEGGEIPFTLEEVQSCCDIAEYNFLQVEKDYDFEGEFCKKVSFIYHTV